VTPAKPPIQDSTQTPSSCSVQPAPADPAQCGEYAGKASRRDFLKAGGMLSLSSLMGTAALMTQSDDAHAAAEWAEHFQKNYRLMTDEEKNEARLRLEKRYSAEIGRASCRERVS
jgi:molybdopterin-containing oxidoreductase family iron-sulfur binding subunit